QIESGINTLTDYVRLRTITSNIISHYGHPSNSEFIVEPVKTQMINFLGSSYQRFNKGAYTLDFKYQPPCQCRDVDATMMPVYIKQFTY
ncbi:MAG: hypothetical protein NTU44_08970, partial [Bacteroidetes bacterium]|nr:hypothetical protein [Bacteroidota bacterium]